MRHYLDYLKILLKFNFKNTAIYTSILLLFISPQLVAKPGTQTLQETIVNHLSVGNLVSVFNNLNSLEPLEELYTVVSVDSTKLESYTGTYQIQSDFKVVISQKEGRLICGVNNSEKYPLYSVSVNAFLLKAVNACIEFTDDENGEFKKIILHYSGRVLQGNRVKVTDGQKIKDQIIKEEEASNGKDYIELSPKILSKYTGTYFNANGEKYYVFYRDVQLQFQAAGEPSLKVFAITEHHFDSKSIPIEIEFSDNGTDSSQSFTLYQNGKEITATRKKNQLSTTPAQAPDKYSLSQFEGTFKIRPGFYITLTKVDNRLSAQISGQEENQAKHLGKAKYYIKALDANIEFIPDSDGDFNTLKIFQSGRTVIAVRLDN